MGSVCFVVCLLYTKKICTLILGGGQPSVCPRRLGALFLTKPGDVESNPGPITLHPCVLYTQL